MAIRIYDEDFSEYVDVPAFEFGESYDTEAGQYLRQMYDGRIQVSDLGYKNRSISGVISNMTETQYWELRKFFENTLNMCSELFYLRVSKEDGDTRYEKVDGANPIAVPVYCGANIIDNTGSSTPLLCGHSSAALPGFTLYCGCTIPAQYEFIGPCRLSKPSIQCPSVAEGFYEVSITAIVEHVAS